MFTIEEHKKRNISTYLPITRLIVDKGKNECSLGIDGRCSRCRSMSINPAPPVTGCQFDKVVGKSDAKIESRHREKFKEMRIKG